jgi:nucleotide-binding universal stress UspA family protein
MVNGSRVRFHNLGNFHESPCVPRICDQWPSVLRHSALVLLHVSDESFEAESRWEMAMTEITGKDGRGRIVVGVDGSEASKDALLWAAHEAALTGASLDVVMVSEMPFRSYGRLIRVPDLDYASEAGHRLQGAIREVLGGSYGGEPWMQSPNLNTIVLEGRPVPALLDAAKGADMLVVGSCGHGALVGRLLGSVSEQCIRYATCPVVVVPHDKQAA